MKMESVKLEPVDGELVRTYIVAAHSNLQEVKALVDREPALIHAVMNWGGDDWESGLGAAAHTGNRDIAEFLLSKGARMDIFTAAMLGEVEIVKSMITRFPEMATAKGAHGIPLIRHAERGGEQALPVLDFLMNDREDEYK